MHFEHDFEPVCNQFSGFYFLIPKPRNPGTAAGREHGATPGRLRRPRDGPAPQRATDGRAAGRHDGSPRSAPGRADGGLRGVASPTPDGGGPRDAVADD